MLEEKPGPRKALLVVEGRLLGDDLYSGNYRHAQENEDPCNQVCVDPVSQKHNVKVSSTNNNAIDRGKENASCPTITFAACKRWWKTGLLPIGSLVGYDMACEQEYLLKSSDEK